MRKPDFTVYFAVICFSIFTLGGRVVHAQVFFSVKPDYVRVKQNKQPLLTVFETEFPDTSITGLHRFLPRNFLGNYGLASPSYLLKVRSPDLGFRFFTPPYDGDRFHESEVPFFRTAGPYASLTGVAGSREFQLFNALFTHTYRNRANVALGFRRYTSLGFYTRQQTYTNNFYFTSNYGSEGKRFGYYFWFLNNQNRHHENGGIRDIFLTDSTILEQKELLNIRFAQASRNNRQNVVTVNPYFILGPLADSVNGIRPAVSLKSRYSGELFQYTHLLDSSDIYYRDNFYSDSLTFDSSRVRQFSNELSLVFRESAFRAQAGYRHEFSRLWQLNDSSLVNHLVFANYSWQPGKDTVFRRFNASAGGQYVLSGSNAGDWKAEASVSLNSSRGKAIAHLSVLLENRTPDQIFRRWRSNHFVWDHPEFPAQQMAAIALRWSPFEWLQAEGVTRLISNYIYFDEDALPARLADPVQVSAISVRFSRVFLRHIGLDLNYRFQVSGAPEAIRLPMHHIQPRLYYRAFLFRNNMQVLMGLDAEIFDSFIPYGYAPSTQVFYAQKFVATSAYPYLDLFFNVRIRPVSVFFKLENALKGFAGPDYFLVPGYYQPDRAFRFGLNWMFFD